MKWQGFLSGCYLTPYGKEVAMACVSYETDDGIFLFDEKDAVEALKDFDSPDARNLIEFLESQTGDTK
jgi:hypothetical protein